MPVGFYCHVSMAYDLDSLQTLLRSARKQFRSRGWGSHFLVSQITVSTCIGPRKLIFECLAGLLFAYIGQAAYISEDKTRTAYTNPFFYNVPPGTLYFSLVIAILAAIVASQALITSTFQLLCQVMRLSYFPNVKTVHTSKLFHYHIYIPAANWLLMICTVSVTAIFDNVSSSMRALGI